MNTLLKFITTFLLLTVTTGLAISQDNPTHIRIITFHEAIMLGLNNSYSLEIQNEKIRQSQLLQKKALASLLPQITAQGTYTRYEKDAEIRLPDLSSLEITNEYPYIKFSKYNTYIIQKENSFGALVNLNMPIVNIPAHLTYKNSKDSIRISELNKESQKSELIYNIALSYLNAIGIKKSMRIIKNSIELSRSHLKIVETKLKNGEANELSLIKANLDLERANNDLEKARKAYNIALESLSLLLNTNNDFDIEENVILDYDIKEDVDALYQKALRNRIDLLILKENHKMIEREINITKSKFLPTLNLNATYRYSDMTSFLEDETQWFIMLSANLNLYDGGLRYIELKEKNSKLRENTLLMQQLVESIKSQIKQSLEEISMCKKSVTSLEKQLELAKMSYELSLKSYNVGIIPQSDLIDSEIAVTTAEILLEKERNDCAINYIKLLKNTGEINLLTMGK
ncbi:MAG: TolC family protein [Deltaproteobacteria bacterium]|nr:TolC family protein [Deltaproteobacteria bacterium]